MSQPRGNELASLGFLDKYISQEKQKYRKASFLRSHFDATTWTLDFGLPSTIEIDFSIQLADETSLTSLAHKDLLDTLKMWICTADSAYSQKGAHTGKKTKMNRVILILNIIDYLLLNDENFQLHKNGLRLFNDNDLKTFLATICRSSNISTSLYNWPERLVKFLLELTQSIPQNELLSLVESNPILLTIPDQHATSEGEPPANEIDEFFQSMPSISTNMVIMMRAALWYKGLYKRCGMTNYRYIPHVRKITELIYPNTLWGKTHHPVPKLLSLSPIERRYTELSRAPIRTKHSAMDARRVKDFAEGCFTLNRLAAHTKCAPITVLKPMSYHYILEHFAIGTSGRFASVPINAVLTSLKSALEFYIQYSEDIVSSYLRIAKAASNQSLSIVQFCSKGSISEYLSPAIINLGVTKWSTEATVDKFALTRRSRSEFFKEFRRSPGLWDLIRVMYGAIQLTVGVLQARRESELRRANALDCLTEDFQSLITINRKTGLMDHNELITRPIPQIAAKMILTLRAMQVELIEMGILDTACEVFSYPSIYGRLQKISHTSFNGSIDFFCDYFETPLDAEGRRYYFRHHQLRRFFAQIFFWHQDEDKNGLDVLRWILGHSDSEMIYHYITESTPGKVLRQIKAEWGSNKIKSASNEVDNLRLFLADKYGSLDFSIISEEALDSYIEHSLQTGEVTIEPQFIPGPNNTSYKILVTINYIPPS
ncbi:TPA: hypothetical protein ACRNQ3_006050 [Pseudomonas aeruginosa]|nr:hypothetical protein [Pseudomonas aeruginosa]HBO3334121.1 hypothetical protein [Pseudomonas aeruginosa]